MAYQRWWKTVRDQQGNAVNGASVAVYNGGTGTLATVYDPNTDDSAPGGLSNPFTTTANGVFGFMATDGEYDVQISGGALATQQYRVTLNGFVSGSAASLSVDLAAPTGAGLIGYSAPYTGASTVKGSSDLLERRSYVDLIPQIERGLAGAGAVSPTQEPTIMIIGDSITTGQGASNFQYSYVYQVERSLWNSLDKGPYYDNGCGHSLMLDAYGFVGMPGVSTTGTLVDGTLTYKRISLAAGQSITITGRPDIVVANVFYDSALSTGSLVFATNGTTQATVATSAGTTVKNTGNQYINSIGKIYPSDTITITASGGTVVVCGVLTLKQSTRSPYLFASGKPGTAYQDFNTATPLDEIATYLNFPGAGAEKHVICELGTNNIYAPSKALSPSAMITQIQTFITGLNALCSSVVYTLSVPPRAHEATFPVVIAPYTYQDYVNAIVAFAQANGHGLIRHDQTPLGLGESGLYVDGVHPTNIGHRIMAKLLCDRINTPMNTRVKSAISPTDPQQAAITFNSTWRNYTNNTLYRPIAEINGNTVTLSGLCEPNGSVSTVVGTIPSYYKPLDRNIYMVGRSDAGAAPFYIDTNGNITLLAVPGGWFSLDGISYTRRRF